MPTIASLLEVAESARQEWQGVDYSRVVRKPRAKGVQDYVVFTFDDIQAGQPSGPYVQTPNRITSIREGRYKLARSYDDSEDDPEPEQWEMYDLKHDPLEVRNIANPDARRTRTQKKAFARLRAKLAEVEETRLQPFSVGWAREP